MLSSTDRPSRKPTCSGGTSPFSDTIWLSRARISRSVSLEMWLVRAIGRKLDTFFLSFPALGIGTIVARLHSLGTFPASHDALMRPRSAERARGPRWQRCSVHTPSGPGAFLRLHRSSWRRSSSPVKGAQQPLRSSPQSWQRWCAVSASLRLTSRSTTGSLTCRATWTYVRLKASALSRSVAMEAPSSADWCHLRQPNYAVPMLHSGHYAGCTVTGSAVAVPPPGFACFVPTYSQETSI